MENVNGNLEYRLLHRIQINLNMLRNCTKFAVDKSTLSSSFLKENKFMPCLTKQLLNMFKLWC